MTASAVILGALGILLTFMPVEASGYLMLNNSPVQPVIMQLLGALYFALAMLDWMTRTSYIGGIYNRPIAIANLSHFMIAGLALLKAVIKDDFLPTILWLLAAIYLIFAILFAGIVFGSPVKNHKKV